MSELEKTAPNEIYLIVGDTDKDCNFNELSEVTWADKSIYEETAIKYVKSSQLTLPKSIADLADKEAFADSHTKFKIFIERYELNRLDRHLNLYCCTEEGRETIFAYMNPSTRDLVEVV